MPGFLGVGAGKVVPVTPDTNAPEVYLIYDGGVLFGGFSTPSIDAIDTGSELASGATTGYSSEDPAALAIAGPRSGDPAFQIHLSTTAGTTWGASQPTVHFPTRQRNGVRLFSLDAGTIYLSADGGTTWTTCVPAISAGIGTLARFHISPTHVYVEVDPAP